MPKTAEQIVREFCDAWGDGKTRTPKIDLIIEMFAEDGEWRLWLPGGPVIKGRAALRAEIERQCEFSTYLQCGITKIVASGSTVVTERVDHFTMHDIRVEHALMAIYDLDAEGKITSWREYFDTADIAAQLGMSPDKVMDG